MILGLSGSCLLLVLKYSINMTVAAMPVTARAARETIEVTPPEPVPATMLKAVYATEKSIVAAKASHSVAWL